MRRKLEPGPVNLSRSKAHLGLRLSSSGAEFTNDRNVSLTSVAPVGTMYMQVSNYSSFDGAFWESLVPSKPGSLLQATGPRPFI